MSVGGEYAINLIPVRPGHAEGFQRFSAEVDQPTLLAQDVVLGIDAYAVTRRDEAAPSVDIVEVMHVRSWDEWVDVRDNSEALKPVTAAFEEHADPNAVRVEPR